MVRWVGLGQPFFDPGQPIGWLDHILVPVLPMECLPPAFAAMLPESAPLCQSVTFLGFTRAIVVQGDVADCLLS